MTEKFIEETVKTEEMTLSQLVWRLLRRQPIGYLERVLDFNRNVESAETYLPVGTVVRLPIENIADNPRKTEIIRPWD